MKPRALSILSAWFLLSASVHNTSAHAADSCLKHPDQTALSSLSTQLSELHGIASTGDEELKDHLQFVAYINGNRTFSEANGALYGTHLKIIHSIPGRNVPPLKSLTDDELIAIRDYTQDGYYEINAALRKKALSPSQATYVKYLDAGLAKLPDFSGVVHRMTTLPAPLLLEHSAGSTIPSASYTSTSKTPKCHSIFCDQPHRFEINTTHGKDISQISSSPDEQEILIPRNSRLKITSVEKGVYGVKFVMTEL